MTEDLPLIRLINALGLPVVRIEEREDVYFLAYDWRPAEGLTQKHYLEGIRLDPNAFELQRHSGSNELRMAAAPVSQEGQQLALLNRLDQLPRETREWSAPYRWSVYAPAAPRR